VNTCGLEIRLHAGSVSSRILSSYMLEHEWYSEREEQKQLEMSQPYSLMFLVPQHLTKANKAAKQLKLKFMVRKVERRKDPSQSQQPLL